ncbi:MAG TPA: urate hydroxylase PuuD [Burkholderiales bacterium]|nr:urate hydroxylase PuuD [Burkholderiales bacterium]
MEAYLLDWLNLLTRWLHIITGIAWIGASFYFVWLDDHLQPPAAAADAAKGVAGELWSVHGGGFYHAQKYRVSPATLPPELHWFKWEAYWTFLSGFFLLCLVYYLNAEVYLIDKSVADIGPGAAVAIGLATLAGGWIVYDRLCESPLGRNERALAIVLAVLLCAAAYGLCRVYGGRGAFIHFGALLGTIMVANVFFVIIPGQRELVDAKLEGREPDPVHGVRGKQRSVHNTYFTLPVLFTMISNHYAGTYGPHYNWAVLIALSAGGALIRVFFVARHKGKASPAPAVIGVLVLAGAAIAMAPATRSAPARDSGAGQADFAAVSAIVAQRCAGCHSAKPTQPGFAEAPKGVMLDSPERIAAQALQINQQVSTRAMPIGNLTQMTDAERKVIADWFQRGAPR